MTTRLLQLASKIDTCDCLAVLTGAGISTDSGIPAYRDHNGDWQHGAPMQHGDFVKNIAARQRYWARSILGWPTIERAEPNAAHLALHELSKKKKFAALVTQNVDGLHQKSGSQNVVDLHGRLDTVICLDCTTQYARQAFQQRLKAINNISSAIEIPLRPDGDVDFDAEDFSHINIPDCENCGGVIKPHVVFFGDSVPKDRVEVVRNALDQSDALLVVGSSLMVFSGYRFVQWMKAAGKPVWCINLGRTRADDEIDLKVNENCAHALQAMVNYLQP
ncbi:MAG: NAD-dependent protein deacetylase [Arenicellales bacterium WSBS_2016_MAG_OTU3]